MGVATVLIALVFMFVFGGGAFLHEEDHPPMPSECVHKCFHFGLRCAVDECAPIDDEEKQDACIDECLVENLKCERECA